MIRMDFFFSWNIIQGNFVPIFVAVLHSLGRGWYYTSKFNARCHLSLVLAQCDPQSHSPAVTYSCGGLFRRWRQHNLRLLQLKCELFDYLKEEITLLRTFIVSVHSLFLCVVTKWRYSLFLLWLFFSLPCFASCGRNFSYWPWTSAVSRHCSWKTWLSLSATRSFPAIKTCGWPWIPLCWTSGTNLVSYYLHTLSISHSVCYLLVCILFNKSSVQVSKFTSSPLYFCTASIPISFQITRNQFWILFFFSFTRKMWSFFFQVFVHVCSTLYDSSDLCKWLLL